MIPTPSMIATWMVTVSVSHLRSDWTPKELGDFIFALITAVTEDLGEEPVAASGCWEDKLVALVFKSREQAVAFTNHWYHTRAKMLANLAREHFTRPVDDIPF